MFRVWVAALLVVTVAIVIGQVGTPRRRITAAPLQRLITEHQRVLDSLNGKGTGGDPLGLEASQVPSLLRKGWNLDGKWAAAYLETHAAPSTHDLEQIFEGFAPTPHGIKSAYGDFLEYPQFGLSGSAVRVGPNVYVVHARYFREDASTDAFMVVARNHEGHFEALWNIKDPAEQHYVQRDEIGRWAYLCRRAYYNGPLNVRKVIQLAPATNGHARFVVDAYQAADGGTALAQLSIWEWDNSEAKPLVIEPYLYARGYGDLQFDGENLRIATKEQLSSFWSCGACDEPRGTWTIRITPTRVENLGHKFVQPELLWADELLSRVDKEQDATDLAGSKVIAALKFHTREKDFTWGMMNELRVLRKGQQGAFELATEGGELRLTYVMRDGQPYFTAVSVQ